MPGFGHNRDLKLLFPLKLHDGGSGLRLNETLALTFIVGSVHVVCH